MGYFPGKIAKCIRSIREASLFKWRVALFTEVQLFLYNLGVQLFQPGFRGSQFGIHYWYLHFLVIIIGLMHLAFFSCGIPYYSPSLVFIFKSGNPHIENQYLKRWKILIFTRGFPLFKIKTKTRLEL